MKAEKPHQTSFSMCLTPGPLDRIVFLLPADPHEVLSCAQGGQGWKWKPRFPFWRGAVRGSSVSIVSPAPAPRESGTALEMEMKDFFPVLFSLPSL